MLWPILSSSILIFMYECDLGLGKSDLNRIKRLGMLPHSETAEQPWIEVRGMSDPNQGSRCLQNAPYRTERSADPP
jgi:hypothetical protein